MNHLNKQKELNPLRIRIGEGSQPIIESIQDIDKSIFSELYYNSFEFIDHFLNTPFQNYSLNNEPFGTEENKNNIIAYIGERGSGKTSCMKSVANMLLENQKQREKSNVGDPNFEKYSNIQKTYFTLSETIDPSFIDGTSNILEIVIAKMFKEFKDYLEKNECYNPNNLNQEDLRHRLIDAFQKVQQELKWTNSTSSKYSDSLDDLVKLASGVDLKKDITELVCLYLRFFNNSNKNGCIDGNNNSYLIITVDDIDLNTQHAFRMIEQIRKYLIQPNILILMAVKLDQLKDVLKIQYITQFNNDDICHNKSIVRFDENTIEEMAERYIQKLIPLNHRIYLPEMESEMERYLLINNEEFPNDEKSNIEKKSQHDNLKIRHKILAMIFEKTRFLFYNTKGLVSYIIPRNLRELRHLVELLEEMPVNDENEIGNSFNKTQFQKYFLETWISNNLSFEKKELFNEIISIKDSTYVNSSVVKTFKKLFEKNNLDYKGDITIEYIFDDKNLVYNISLGDVMGIMNRYENLISNLDDKKFCFAVKTYYSIMLYQYYNELTANGEGSLIETNNLNYSETPNKNKEIMKRDLLYGYSNYSKLVGGSFINSLIVDLLPSNLKKIDRSQRLIDGQIIRNLIQDIKNERSDDNFKLFEKIHLVEFFALMISRSEDERKNPNFRHSSEPYYSSDLSFVKKNFWFDITSSFYNCMNIKYTYNRLDPELFDDINKIDIKQIDENKSLSYKLKLIFETHRKEKKNLNQKIFSTCAFRNIEILDDLVNYLIRTKPKGKTEDSLVLADFLDQISSYYIFTYDKSENDYLEIKYPHFKVISSYLKKITNSEIINKTFNSIYNNSILNNEINFKFNLYNFNNISGNKVETILKRLKEQNKDFINLEQLNIILKKYFTKRKYTREEVEKICRIIKQELNQSNG